MKISFEDLKECIDETNSKLEFFEKFMMKFGDYIMYSERLGDKSKANEIMMKMVADFDTYIDSFRS